MAQKKDSPKKEGFAQIEDNPAEKEKFTQLLVTEVAGVIGVLCLHRNENGRLLSAIFNPLTEQLAQRLELKEYKGKLAAQSQKAQQLLDSGKLDDMKWLAQNMLFQGSDSERRTIIDAIVELNSSTAGKHRLAQAFAGRNNPTTPIKLIVANVGGSDGYTNKIKQEIVIDPSLFNDELHMYYVTDKVIPHEILHMGQKNPPDSLNAREHAVWNAMVIEAEPRATTEIEKYYMIRNILQVEDISKQNEFFQKKLKELFTKGGAKCTWEEFVSLHKTAFNKIFDQCIPKLYEELFIEALIKQSEKDTYICQMIGRANHKNTGNLKALKILIEDMCQNGNPKIKMNKERIWKIVESYATGKKEIPAVKGLFTKKGESLLPLEILRVNQSNTQIQKLLNDPYEYADWMERTYGARWADKCHPELAQKFLKIVKGKKTPSNFKMPDIEQIKEIQELGKKLREKYPEISAKCSSMFGSQPFTETETTDAKFQYSVYKDTSPEIVNDPDFIKWLQLDDIRRRWVESKEKIPLKQRLEQFLIANLEQAVKKKKTPHSLPRKTNGGVGKVFMDFGKHWTLIQAASFGGRMLRDTDIPEAHGAPLIEEQARWQTTAQQKANTLLAAGGITTSTVGIILHSGSAMGAKWVTTGAAKVGMKSLPIVGTALGLGWAGYRFGRGDFTGAGMELASAACDAVGLVACAPGAQGLVAAIPAASATGLAIDVDLAIRDALMKDGKYSFALLDKNEKPIMVKDENENDIPALGLSVEFKNGKREGTAVWYGIDDKGHQFIRAVGEYKNDQKHGEWFQKDADGRVCAVAHYDKGQLVDYTKVDKNGLIIAQGNFIDGQYVEYWTDDKGNVINKIRQVAQFKNRRPTGFWGGYDLKGYPTYAMDYEKRYYVAYKIAKDSNVLVDEKGHLTRIDSGTIREDGMFISYQVGKYGFHHLNTSYTPSSTNQPNPTDYSSVHNPLPTGISADYSTHPQKIGLPDGNLHDPIEENTTPVSSPVSGSQTPKKPEPPKPVAPPIPNGDKTKKPEAKKPEAKPTPKTASKPQEQAKKPEQKVSGNKPQAQQQPRIITSEGIVFDWNGTSYERVGHIGKDNMVIFEDDKAHPNNPPVVDRRINPGKKETTGKIIGQTNTTPESKIFHDLGSMTGMSHTPEGMQDYFQYDRKTGKFVFVRTNGVYSTIIQGDSANGNITKVYPPVQEKVNKQSETKKTENQKQTQKPEAKQEQKPTQKPQEQTKNMQRKADSVQEENKPKGVLNRLIHASMDLLKQHKENIERQTKR